MAELAPWLAQKTVPVAPWLAAKNEALPTPTAEELQKYSVPQEGREKLVPQSKALEDNTGFTEEEKNTIPLGNMDVEQTIQSNRDQTVGNEYKDYQSGNVIQKDGEEPTVRSKSLGDTEITTDMYDKSSNPKRLFELLKENSEGTSITGHPIYKGKVVPYPTDYSGTGLDPTKPMGSITGSDLAADTIREAGKNTIVTLAANFDELANAAGIKTNLTQMAQEGIADPAEAKKTSHAIAKEAMRITASVVAGNRLGTSIASKSNSGPLDTKLIAATAALAIENITNSPDSGTLVTGDNALVELMHGVPIDENGRPSQKVLSKKLNMFQDAVMTGGPIAAGINLGVLAGRLTSRVVVNTFQDFLPGTASAEKRMAREMLESFGVGDEEGVKKLQTYLQDHREEVVKFADGTLDDATVKRSSMSAIAEGANNEGDFLTGNKALQMEKAVEKQGDSELLTLKQQPMREMSRVQQQASDSRGGMDAVNQVHDKVADLAIESLGGNNAKLAGVRSEVDDIVNQTRVDTANRLTNQKMQNDLSVGTAKDILSGAESDVKVASEGLSQLYKSDAAFAKTIDHLSKQSGIDVANKFRQNRLDRIVPDMVGSVKKVLDKKDELYKLPEEVLGDMDSFEEVVGNAVESGHISPRLQKTLTAEFPGLFSNADDAEPASFNSMYAKVLPKVNREIADEYAKGVKADPELIKSLEAISDNINGTQMDLLEKEYPQYAAQLRKAKEYYKDTVLYYKKSKSSPMGILFSAYDTAWDDFHGTLNEAGDTITGIGKNVEVGEKAISALDSISDKNPYYSKQVIDFMKSNPEYQGDGGKQLKELVQSDVAGAISDVLMKNNGDLSKVTPDLIYNTLKDKGAVLTKRLPAETKQINKFIEDFKKVKSNVSKSDEWLKAAKEGVKTTNKDAKTALSTVKTENKEILETVEKEGKTVLKDAKAEKKLADAEVYKSALGRFIEKTPDGAVPKGNSFDTFKKLLGKDGNERTVKDLVSRVRKSGDKDAQKGLEAAMFEYMSESLPSKANDFKMTPAGVHRALSDRASLQKYGREIFGDSPEKLDTWNSYLKVIDLVDKEAKKESSTTLALQTGNEAENAAKKSLNYIVGIFFKKLNPTAMRLTSTGGRVIEAANIQEKRQAIQAAMHTDPEYLSDLFELVKNEAGKTSNSEFKRNLVLSGILLGRDAAVPSDKEEKKVPPGVK